MVRAKKSRKKKPLPDHGAFPPSTDVKFPFLGLPTELRNIIYRMLLTSTRPIEIGPTGFEEPALLSTCKQIRKEASTVFFGENKFKVRISDYKAHGCLHWERKLRALYNRNEKPRTIISCVERLPQTARKWDDLLVWLKNFYTEDIRMRFHMPSEQSGANTEYLVMGGMFDIVAKLRALPWHTVESILQEQRVILAKIKPEWNGETV